jgi:hypothetical protein
MSTQSPDDLPTLPPPAVAEPVISEKQHPDRQHKGRLMETPQRLIATVLKLFLLSVVVGWLISVLNTTIEGFSVTSPTLSARLWIGRGGS